ncbi:MAG: hypothetical protein MJ175_10385 [Clostridia bacterium]|nr:hypothetical protein [Clostridia bacterium]
MRRILFLLLCVTMVFVSTSCGESASYKIVPVDDLLTTALGCYSSDVHRDPALQKSGSDTALDDSTAGYFFYGEYDREIPELANVEAYALAASSGIYPFEIDILFAASDDTVSDAKTLLDARAEVKSASRGEINNYEPAWLPMVDDMEVFTVGRYAILLATPDNDAADNAIRELIKADPAETAGETAETAPTGTIGHTANGEVITDFASKVDEGLALGIADVPGPADEDMSLAQSALPVITLQNYSQNDFINLGGTCEKGAVIHIRGNGNDFVFHTDDGNWIVEVGIASRGTTTLSVTQEETGKRESEPILVTARARDDIDRSYNGVCQVAIGDYGQGHFYGQMEDYCGTNLLSDKQIDSLTGRIKEKVNYLAKNNCELIYMIVPNPIAIYPETAPYFWEKSTKDTSRTEQFENAARAAGATVLDLTDTLMAHRDDEFKIFHKTDSHWTQYGAYWGYKALLDYIHNDWSDAEALPIDGNFEFYHKYIVGGDMMTHGGIDNNLFHENGTFVKWLTKAVANPDVYLELFGEPTNQMSFVPVQDTETVKNKLNKDKKLPTAMIIRDSFSANCYGYLNNAFSEVYWQAMWDYDFDKSYIKETKPDYYIVLIAERNIFNVLG